MYYGWPSLCLDVEDLAASTHFYRALGMEIMPEECAEGQRVVLRSGVFRLGLFVGIGGNLLNFRGADVFAVHEELSARLPGLSGEPERYEPNAPYAAEAPGACWSTLDPSGNVIFFDTNRNEEGPSFAADRIAKVLRDTEDELVRLGASEECLATFRSQMLDRFAPV